MVPTSQANFVWARHDRPVRPIFEELKRRNILVRYMAYEGYGDGLRAPLWLWSAGIMGLVVILSITYATPRIGATATIGLLIAGQLAMGAVIDRFGLFGLEQIPIGWTRLLGIALLALGAALSLRR